MRESVVERERGGISVYIFCVNRFFADLVVYHEYKL